MSLSYGGLWHIVVEVAFCLYTRLPWAYVHAVFVI